jgi:hypothetical protein
MPEERTPTTVEEDGQVDHAIILLLLDRDDQRPWAEQELKREIGSDVTDSLTRLYAVGLIHRLDGFVWATRAALAAEAIGV